MCAAGLTHTHSMVAKSVPALQPRLPARRQLVRLCFGRCQSWGLRSHEERIPTGGGRIHKSRAAPERPDGRNLCAPLLRPMAFNATEIPPGAVASALCDPTMCETGLPHKHSIVAGSVPVLESRPPASPARAVVFRPVSIVGPTCGVLVQPAMKLNARPMSSPD